MRALTAVQLALSLGCAAVVGCAGPASSVGFVCTADADCGAGVTCERYLCGGPAVPAAPLAQPTVANTGARTPPPVLHQGDVSLEASGEVFAGHRVEGTLFIRANDVTVRDCEVVGGALGAIVIAEGVTGTRVEHTTIGPTPSWGIVGDAFFAVAVRLDSGAGFVGAVDSWIERSYFAPTIESNAPMVSVRGGDRTVLLGNRCQTRNAVCVEAAPADAPLRGLLIERNVFVTDGAAIDVSRVGEAEPVGTRIFKNRFATSAAQCPVTTDGHRIDGSASDCNTGPGGECCFLP